MRIPYDKLWKAMVTAYFHDFLEMFLPELFEQTNLDIPPKFLEQELHAALTDKTIKVADKLVQVTLKSGEEKWVYVHIEFETDPKKNIGERMFGYYQRIAAKYGRSITAIVIYTGDRIPKISDLYEEKNFGTRVLYEFNTYKIKEQNETELINNPNPFAVFVLANLYVIQTKNDDGKRFAFKRKVYETALARNYSREKIQKLLTFVFDLMKLKPLSENKLYEILNNFKMKSDAEYIPKSTGRLADLFSEINYGKTFPALKAELKVEKDMLKAEKETLIAEKDKLKAEKDLWMINAIEKLYTKQKLSVEDIAETLSVETKYVRKVLKAKDLLKK